MNVYEFIIKLKDQTTGGLKQMAQSLGITQNRVKDLDDEFKRMNRTQNALSSGLGVLKGAFLGVVAGISFLSLTSQVIEARSEYEKFQAVLTNSFQSTSVAQSALNMLSEFAEKTPYQLNELTGAFVKLVNRGFLPTYEQLTSLGDLASSQGKSFDQLTEAILDAETGEFERLKEFGIKASKAGDMVTFSFKGVTKEVQNNSEALRSAILEYGNMEGVAGAMEAVSKTLGGQLGQLQEKYNNFLVALGGFSSPIILSLFNGLGKGLDYILYALPYVANWFSLLWKSIEPVITSIGNFINAAFSLGDVGNAMQNFGDIMTGVLYVVDTFSVGLSWLIGMLEPFAPLILTIVGAWAILNAIFAITPIGWLVIGIVALISIIGLVIKYTAGWGKSWEALSTILKAVWSTIKSDFNIGVESIKTGFKLMVLYAENTAQSIAGKFANLGQAIEMALAGDFEGAMSKAFEKVKTNADAEIQKTIKEFEILKKNGDKLRTENGKTITQASKDFGITIDTDGIKKDFDKIKNQFSNIGEADRSTTAYLNKASENNLLGTGAGTNNDAKDKKDKAKTTKDGIVSGGSKQTNIIVNIESVGKEITIHVDKTETGVSQLGDKIREELLRAINSVNQMQTS